MRILAKKTVGLVALSILLTFSASVFGAEKERLYKEIELGTNAGYGTRVQEYQVPEGFPKFEPRTRFIGNIRGTWYEMGVQYGKRAGDLIRYAADYEWMTKVERFGPEHLKEDIGRYAKAIDDYSPKMTEFLKGIADGASEEMAKSPYTGKVSDFERVVLINVLAALNWMHPSPELHKGKTTPMPKKSSMHINPAPKKPGIACTGMALGGKSKVIAKGILPSPTKNGETIITQNIDIDPYVPWGWNVAYVATPSDPEANVFWSIACAGAAGGNNLIVNDKGLGMGLYYGGITDDPDDFGVTWQALYVYTAAYADNVKEAIKLLTFGPSEYRTRTGRKIVCHATNWGYMLADPDDLAVVEVTSHRYAIRYPGDREEIGNYVIYSNYYGTNHYYDENNVRMDRPIGIDKIFFDAEERYYTTEWHIRHHFGDMDIDKAKETQSLRFYYDKETGRRLEFQEDGISPLHLIKHTPNWNTKGNTGGTMWGSNAILRKNGKSEIWWNKGNPAEWLGPWQHTDFAGYGK